MKNQFLIITLIALLSVSCGNETAIDTTQINFADVLNSKNLDSINAKKDALYAQQQVITEQLKQLNERITILDKSAKLPLISTITTKTSPFIHYIELQGNVTTKSLVTLSAEFNGLLTDVLVKKGDKVVKGQILARIDDGGLTQQLAQMKIQRDLAETTFERQKRLWEQNIGSEIQYLQAKSNFEAQTEAINQMNQQLAKSQVRAPFSGTIDEIFTEQGNLVTGGVPLMRLISLNDMYIETNVPERYIAGVTKGKTVEIEFPVLGKSMTSAIRQAGDFINPSNRTYSIEVPVTENNGNIKPNLTARLKINDYSNQSAILIPQNIISEDAEGEQYIYALSNIQNGIGTVERVNISTGLTQDNVIEVTTGLTEGMTLIKEGARTVKDGQRVRVDSLK
jgi:RND family efflux transporter MFP subunit